MKRIIKVLFLLVLFVPFFVFGEEKEINMYLFYGDGCPHCAELEAYLTPYLKKHKNVHLYKYEVWYNEENANKYVEVHELLNDGSSGIPYLVIGNTTLVGWNRESTPDRVENTVKYYMQTKYKDNVGIYLGVVEDTKEEEHEEEKYQEEEMDIPIIGRKNIKDVSISD